MTKTVMTRIQEEQIRQALTALAKTHSVEGQYGIIDFTYDEVIQAAGDKLNSRTYVSVWLNALEAAGKLVRIRRGTSFYPSRWDVSKFIAPKQIEQPKAPAPAPAEVPVQQLEAAPEVTLDATKNQVVIKIEGEKLPKQPTGEMLGATIKEMTEYLKTMTEDMTDYLEDLSRDVRGVTPAEIKSMEKQIATLQTDLKAYKADNENLKFQLEMKERELKSKPELKVNKAEIIRQTHLVIDEIERFLGKVPSWSKAGPEHFSAMIKARLHNILDEVGAGE